MTFEPFPVSANIATYSEEQIPFRVPADMGYTDGEAMGNMDPIEPPPVFTQKPSAMKKSHEPKQKRVSFDKPRSSSHGETFKNIAGALNPFKRSHREQLAEFSLPPRASSDTGRTRPDMSKYGLEVSENAIASDDDIMANFGFGNFPNNLSPAAVNPNEIDNYILYSTSGLSYGVADAQPQPLYRQSHQSHQHPYAYQYQSQPVSRANSHRRHQQTQQGPPPAYSTVTQAHARPHYEQPAARAIRKKPAFNPVEMLNFLKAPVLAVDKPEARIFVIVLEAVVLLMAFNWLVAIFDNGVPTLIGLGLGAVYLNSIYQRSLLQNPPGQSSSSRLSSYK